METDLFPCLWRDYTQSDACCKPIGIIEEVTGENARIAAAAAARFHEQGIAATGVDALSQAAGISKRTLYQRFGSKDGLIVAAYDCLDRPVFEMFTGPAERASATPRGQLEAFFAQVEAMVKLPEFRGCPFTNASSELADPDHPAHAVVRRHKERIRKWILTRARAAGAANPAQPPDSSCSSSLASSRRRSSSDPHVPHAKPASSREHSSTPRFPAKTRPDHYSVPPAAQPPLNGEHHGERERRTRSGGSEPRCG